MSDAGRQFRVIASDLLTLNKRVIASGKTEKDAEAIVSMAIARRGVETEFYFVEQEP